MKASSLLLLLAALLLSSCQENGDIADAYGNFEAREVIVSAEGSGQLLRFSVEEGQELQAGQLIGLIDTTPLHLKRRQLRASIQAVGGKTQEVQPQVDVLQEQKQNLLREEKRLKALVADNAATPKQLDDIQGQIEVVDKQIAATLSQNKNLNQGILAEIAPLQAQIEVVEDQIRKCYVVNPIDGAVLLKLAEPYEMAAMGKCVLRAAGYLLGMCHFMPDVDAPGTYHDFLAREGRAAENGEILEIASAAWRLVHLLFYRRPLPFAPVKQTKWYAGEMAYQSLDELAPGRDPILDRICEAFMTGAPLHPETIPSRAAAPDQERAAIRNHLSTLGVM